MTAPHREDFARWREDRVTQWVFAAFETMAEQQKAAWNQISWENGVANANALNELRTRADAYRAVFETDYEAFCDVNGDDLNDQS